MALSTNLDLPRFRYTITSTDANGNTYLAPAVGYKLYIYEAGTSTQLTVYQDKDLTTPHSQPITLDSDGSATVFFNQEAKIELQDTDSATVSGFPVDGVRPISSTSTATIDEWQGSGAVGTYVSGSTFTVPGDLTATFVVGRRVRLDEGGSYRYGEITTSAYTTSTAVTVNLDSGSITSAIDGNEVYLHINSNFLTLDTEQTATNKTLTSPVIDGSLTGTAIGRGALVYNSANQSTTTATYTHLAFDTEEYDTDTIHDTSTNNNRLTVPSGVTKIKLHGQAIFSANQTGLRFVGFSKNDETTTPTHVVGMPYSYTATSGINVSYPVAISSPTIDVTAGDYFTLCVRQTSGGDLNVLASTSGLYTYFCMEIIQ